MEVTKKLVVKLIHLLSTTWFTVPVRRMEDWDQRHKGREVALDCFQLNSTCWEHLLLQEALFE